MGEIILDLLAVLVLISFLRYVVSGRGGHRPPPSSTPPTKPPPKPADAARSARPRH